MSHIKNVAIIGATATAGKYVVEELLRLGRHTVTAITREDSKAVMPEGVKVAKVDYDDHASIVAALQGQEVLMINLSVMAPRDLQSKIIQAAADANVPWIIPNEWTLDQDHPKFTDEALHGQAIRAGREQIEKLGKSSWIGVTSSFWYEFSLATPFYGFDLVNRSVTFFDDGNTPINTTTLPQCGRALAHLLSLKIEPEDDSDKSVTLSTYKNKAIYISSFCINQQEMFESVLRVTKTKKDDWKINFEDSKERYNKAMEALQRGDRAAFGVAMYTRVFFPDARGAYEKAGKLDNELLGLPKENVDDFSKLAFDKATAGLPAYGEHA
ncbi:CipA protein [Xylariales sp. PMI_506]|nr:CipA protein [Xylariales sp. PMI_506]